MKKITIVVALKNRSEKTVKNFLDSLLNQAYPCDIIVVDFGSSEENLAWERKLFTKINFIEAKTNLNPYKSSRALNIAIKRVKTPFTLITDIDLIFSKNFIKEVMRILNDKMVVLCRRLDLDEEGNELTLHSVAAFGACLAVSTSWLKKVHGFDEKYTYWGREDDDMFDRIKQGGFKPIWLDTEIVSIKHQWHPKPIADTFEENKKYYEIPNKPLIRNPKEWGKI